MFLWPDLGHAGGLIIGRPDVGENSMTSRPTSQPNAGAGLSQPAGFGAAAAWAAGGTLLGRDRILIIFQTLATCTVTSTYYLF